MSHPHPGSQIPNKSEFGSALVDGALVEGIKVVNG
jgi:hypothetical protein